MKSIILTRKTSGDQGTFGTLRDVHTTWHTLELPWRDLDNNGLGDPQRSCITTGKYILKWHESPSKGWCYEVTGVVGRSHILIHSANFAGDEKMGYQSQLLGCIALGMGAGEMKNSFGKMQKCVTASRTACKQFFDWGAMQPIELTIVGPL